jgi:hypothetical protein
MAEEQLPFADVRVLEDGAVSIPSLKWRELLFVGAIRPAEGFYERDPARPLPPFRLSDLFPEGALFEATTVDDRVEVRQRVREAQRKAPGTGL